MADESLEYYSHPCLRPNGVFLQTHAMKRFRELILRWLWNGATGGVITGESRVGKTYAVRGLINTLRTRANTPIPANYMEAPTRDQKTIASVFRHLCWAAGIGALRSERADFLSDRFVHFVADRAEETGCDQAVLFVDEMQRLLPEQINAFAEVYDKLEWFGVNLCIIFIGNDMESDKLIRVIQEKELAHIYGRFFTQSVSYPGLSSEKELRHCLVQYDKLSYPDGGPCYTAFFLPEAFKDGFRMASLSHLLWQGFSKVETLCHCSSWPMKYFVVTANAMLTDFLPHHGVEHVDEGMIKASIETSGLIPSSVRQVV